MSNLSLSEQNENAISQQFPPKTTGKFFRCHAGFRFPFPPCVSFSQLLQIPYFFYRPLESASNDFQKKSTNKLPSTFKHSPLWASFFNVARFFSEFSYFLFHLLTCPSRSIFQEVYNLLTHASETSVVEGIEKRCGTWNAWHEQAMKKSETKIKTCP